MQKNNFKQDHKSPASNQKLKKQEIKGAEAEQAQRNAATPRGSWDDKSQGAQDAQMKTRRSSDVESADFSDQDNIDLDDSTKAFAADSKSRGSKLDDVQSQPSKRGSQNSRH